MRLFQGASTAAERGIEAQRDGFEGSRINHGSKIGVEEGSCIERVEGLGR